MSDPPPPPLGSPSAPPPAPLGLDRLGMMDLLLALILGFGSVRLLGLLAENLLGGSDGSFRVQGSGAVALVLLALVLQAAALVGTVYWVAVRRRGIAWADLGLRPLRRRWIVGATATALFSLPLLTLVNLSIQEAMGSPQRNPQFDFMAPAGFSWPSLVGMLVLAGAVVPFAEELFFRGLLYGWLRRRVGVFTAALLTALLFAVPHGIVWLIPALTALGVILALVYEKSGSLWAATLTHGLFNAITTLLLYLFLAMDWKI